VHDWGQRDIRWRGIRSETVRVDDTDVHLLRADDEGHGDGMPRLLVHGLGGAALNWLDVIGGLASGGPVVAMDLPGFGMTEPPHPHAPRMFPQVRFLHRLVDRLQWPQFELHGNSMGGLIGTLFAARYPDRVARLVLVNPVMPFAPSPGGTSPTAMVRFAPFVSRHLGHAAIRARWRDAVGADVYDETLAIVLGEAGRIRPPLREAAIENTEFGLRTAWRQRSLATASSNLVYATIRAPLRQAVASVKAPTLLVWGEQDRLVSRAMIERAARRRPDWTRIDLPLVGHAPMLEVPDRYLAMVGDWRRDLLKAGTG
jgi:pimeloyl-ACP methyl ester carboxylesterase